MTLLRLPSQNLALLWCCQCVTTLGLMAMVPIMPLYLAQLGVGYSAVWSSAALAAPAVTALALAPRIGKACDRYGYRKMVLLSLLGFAISMGLMALSRDIAGFLLGRLLLGACGVGVTLTAFACALSNVANRGRMLGSLQSASACGCLLGPIIGGVLLDLWSLRPLLFATATFSAVAALLASWGLHEPAVAETPALAASPGRATWLSTLRHPFSRNWMFAACLAQAAAFALVNTFVLYLNPFVPDVSLASATGLIHAAAWAATMLASPWWGRANDKGGARRHFCCAALGCALAVALLPFANELWQIVLLRVLQGACFAALAQSVFFALSHASYKQGEGVGLAKSYLVLGQIVGPAVVAALLPWLPPDKVLWWVSLLFALAALSAFRAEKQFADPAKLGAGELIKN
jgi:MFS family permease